MKLIYSIQSCGKISNYPKQNFGYHQFLWDAAKDSAVSGMISIVTHEIYVAGRNTGYPSTGVWNIVEVLIVDCQISAVRNQMVSGQSNNTLYIGYLCVRIGVKYQDVPSVQCVFR